MQGLFCYNPDFFKMIQGDRCNIEGFAFEELMNSRILAEALNKGVPLKLIEGDGAGKLNEMPTPKYVDVVVQDLDTNKLTAIQYKNTVNEFHDGVHNVDAMIDKWTATWQGKGDPNLPTEMQLDNVEIVIPKGVGQDAVKHGDRVTDEFSIGKLKVESFSPTELDAFIQQNDTKLKEMVKTHTDIKALESTKAKLESNLEKLEQVKESMQKAQPNGVLQKKIAEKTKKISDTIEEIKDAVDKIEKKSSELKEMNQNAHLDDIELNAQKKQAAEVKANEQREAIREGRVKEKQRLKKELKQSILLAVAISGGQELVISLIEEYQNYQRGRITKMEMMENVGKRTTKV